MRRRAAKNKTGRNRFAAATWAVTGFAMIGFLPTALMPKHNPVASFALAACAVIPFGSKSLTWTQAVLRGLGLGAVAGLAIAGAMGAFQMRPAEMCRLVSLWGGFTALLCAIVATLFFHLAARRKKEAQKKWR